MSEGAKTLADLIAAGQVKKTPVPFPAIVEFCTTTPLYQEVKVDEIYLEHIRVRSIQFDAYCVGCEKEAVFYHRSNFTGTSTAALVSKPGDFRLDFSCGRAGHEYVFYFRVLPELTLVKVGQVPAIADLTGASLRKYKPLLRGGYFEELTKANGLISHGVGIGAFVYLRRIFEKLIQDHRADFERRNGPITGFDGLRMAERIEALKSELPASLVANRAIYGILSSGIHELSEADCKLYYPVVQKAIIQILEQDYEARERKRSADELEEEVRKIQQVLGSKKDTNPSP